MCSLGGGGGGGGGSRGIILAIKGYVISSVFMQILIPYSGYLDKECQKPNFNSSQSN